MLANIAYILAPVGLFFISVGLINRVAWLRFDRRTKRRSEQDRNGTRYAGWSCPDYGWWRRKALPKVRHFTDWWF